MRLACDETGVWLKDIGEEQPSEHPPHPRRSRVTRQLAADLPQAPGRERARHAGEADRADVGRLLRRVYRGGQITVAILLHLARLWQAARAALRWNVACSGAKL